MYKILYEEQVEHFLFFYFSSVDILRSNMNRIDWVKRDTLDTDAHFWSEKFWLMNFGRKRRRFQIEGAYFDLTVYFPDVVVSRSRLDSLDTPAIKSKC